MKINSKKSSFPFKRKVLINIMRIFVFLCFTTVFSLTPDSVLSQNSKVIIDSNKSLTVDEVFDLIMEQTDYEFIYQEGIFDDFPKVQLKKGKISTNKLLEKSLSKGSYKIVLTENNTVLVKKDVTVNVVKKQEFEISGIVNNNNGQPLPGANILEKGTSNGTQTDFDGNFSLTVSNENATLVVSYIGFLTQEVQLGGKTSFIITLQEDAAKLDEVVVVGYGSQKKVNLTGAVSSVKGDDINKRPITQGSQALQGITPGVYINTNSGEPGNDNAAITIRGVGTLNNAEPLVLIDGIEAPLNSINPNDIETINVLKDAASASIYGTRAANGVVLITTKRGTVGKTVVNYNAYLSTTRPTVLPKTVTDTKLYLQTYVKAAERTGRNHPFTPALIDEIASLGSKNWVGDFIETGIIQNHDLAISGGSKKIKYRWSTSYLDQDDYLKGDYFLKRFNTRLNLDFSLNDKIKSGVSMAFVNNNNRQMPKGDPSRGIGNGTVDPFAGKGNFLYQILLVNPPNQFPYDEFGRYGGTGGESSRSQRDNPQALIDTQWIDVDGTEFFGNAFLEYEPIEDLKIKYTAAINSQKESYASTRLEYEQYDRFGNRSALRNSGSLLRTQESSIQNITNWLQATWKKSIDNHNFNLLAGVNQETSTIRRIATYEKGFGSTALVRVGNGTENVDIANFNGEWALQSVFGRLNYNYKDKYLFEANVRRDGSSRFGSKSRWATFPGVSAGYVLSKEDFWKSDFITLLKLRASWGKLGVQSSNYYPFAAEFSSGTDYNGVSGSSLTKLGNQNLAWEETKVTDFGVDLRLFGGKVSLEADYFIKESSGILTDLPNPITTGISSNITVNAASVENKGWDMSLRTNNQIGKLKIRTGLNITNVKNKVLQIDPSLTDGDDFLRVGYASYWKRGEAAGAIIAHEFGGIFQEEDFNPDGTLVSGIDYSTISSVAPRTGDIKYTDQNGDNIINDEDRVVVGNQNPEWLYGFNLDLEYKGFDMSVFLQGVGETNSMVNRYTGNFGHSGLREFWLNAWTPENRSNTIPAIFVDRDGFNGRTIASGSQGGFGNQNSFWVINQQYLRLKNIVIGYSLPAEVLEKLSVDRLRLYVSGQNLWTSSKLDDLDPERNANVNHFGGTLPQQKVITVGLNVTF